MQVVFDFYIVTRIRNFLEMKCTEIYAKYDTETKRAIENAYPDLIKTDLLNWNEYNDF